VAQFFALARPERALIATSSTVHLSLLPRVTHTDKGEMGALRTEAIMRWFAPATIVQNGVVCAVCEAEGGERESGGVGGGVEGDGGVGLLGAVLGGLDVLVLVLAGEKDSISTPVRVRPIAKAAKRVRYVEVKGGRI
jgi:hypothetical protein